MLWKKQSQQNNSENALALCCCLRVNICSTLQSNRKKETKKSLKKNQCACKNKATSGGAEEIAGFILKRILGYS